MTGGPTRTAPARRRDRHRRRIPARPIRTFARLQPTRTSATARTEPSAHGPHRAGNRNGRPIPGCSTAGSTAPPTRTGLTSCRRPTGYRGNRGPAAAPVQRGREPQPSGDSRVPGARMWCSQFHDGPNAMEIGKQREHCTPRGVLPWLAALDRPAGQALLTYFPEGALQARPRVNTCA